MSIAEKREITWEERARYYNADYFDGNLPGHYADWWWTDFSVWGPRARVIHEAFKPRSVLVCGCAKGSLVKFLHSIYGIGAFGFDLSEYAIATTPYPEIDGRLQIFDAATGEFPYGDRQFDVVACYDFIEHIDDDHIIHVCNEVSRVCNQNIAIRSPIVPEPEKVADLHRSMKGLSFDARMEILRSYPWYREWEPDPDNIEHPNTMGRSALVGLFPDFQEVFLEPELYDIMMGSDLNCQTPVLPFYDTVILEKNV